MQNLAGATNVFCHSRARQQPAGPSDRWRKSGNDRKPKDYFYVFLQDYFFSLILFCFTLPSGFAHHDGFTPTGIKEGDYQDSISSGAMLNSPTASTLGRNRFSAVFTFDYLRFNSIPANDAHRLHHRGRDVHGKNHEEFYNFDLAWGALRDLDFYLVAPIVSKNSIDIHSHRGLGKKESARGFGDMKLIGKYRFWEKQVEAALISGIKFPTGRTNDRRANGSKYETELQPGSGSWDAEFGLALSRNFKKRVSAATSFQYFLNTEGAQEHETGDAFRASVASAFHFRELGKYPNVSLNTELNFEWALKDSSRQFKEVFDSGGATFFITPGMNASLNPHFSLFWAIPIPFYQNLGGQHEELKFELLAGANVTL